jgi:hypothetical protein
MTDLEARLEHALQAGGAPAPDPMFRIQILMRRERSAFHRRVLIGCTTALAAAVLLALGLGVIDALASPGTELLARLAGAVLTLAALFALPSTGMLPALRSLAGTWRAGASSALRTGSRGWLGD